MQDYNFVKLGSEKFQKFIQALLVKEIGPGVTPFGEGIDGSRDATFHGKSGYPSEVGGWDGMWLFQVKFSINVNDSGKVITDLRNELQKVTEKYNYKIDNYILITNIKFSGTPKTGTHERVEKEKEKYSHRIKNMEAWDYHKICRLLDKYFDLRIAFDLRTDTDMPILQSSFTKLRTEQELRKYYGIDESLNSDVRTTELKNVYDIVTKWFNKRLGEKGIFLITGDPGIGKSWLSYQVVSKLMAEMNKIFVISSLFNKGEFLINFSHIDNSSDTKTLCELYLLDDNEISLIDISTTH